MARVEHLDDTHDEATRSSDVSTWILPLAVIVVVWRILALVAPFDRASAPGPLLRWLLAIEGLAFLATAVWTFRRRPGRATFLFALYGLSGGLHWGGPIAVPALAADLMVGLYLTLSSLLGQAVLVHLALAFPPAWRASRSRPLQALLYLPSEPPMDLFFDTGRFGLQLYVRNVLIMDTCEELLPKYLRFVKGMVDSSDLPLNISRQRLQEDRHIAQIRKWVSRKVLDTLADMAKNEAETYRTFWRHFGAVLKEGVAFDPENKERLVPLVRFYSSTQDDQLTSLADYVARMKPEQKDIYYLTGASRETIAGSPHLEALKARGLEVLLLTDPIDELGVQALGQFADRNLKSVGKGTVALGTDEEQNQTRRDLNARQVEYLDLMTLLRKKLDKHVKEVRLTNRLTNSPACLVVSEEDLSPRLARLLRAQHGQPPGQQRILELNPEHSIVRKLRERALADRDDPLIDDYAELLYGGALIAEGSEVNEPARFNEALARLMAGNL